MKRIIEVTNLAPYVQKPGGLVFAANETRELIDEKDIHAFESTGDNRLDDGSPAFKVKEKKITKKEEEKKIEKLEKEGDK